MKCLVFGANGQIGSAMKACVVNAVCLERKDADFSKPATLEAVLEAHRPDIVINAAAYTQVDGAEAEENLAAIINAEAPAAIAIYCARENIPFVHFSTDYVFDGTGNVPWREDDTVSPLNAYGRTKLAGEDKIQQVGGRFLILRTSWLYDATGRNFLNTILRVAAEREELRVVSDQFGAPTYVPDLARASLNILHRALQKDAFPSGVYHLCHAGEVSWHGFAAEIVSQARQHAQTLKVKSLKAIPSSDYPTQAPRPLNSRLDCGKVRRLFDLTMPSWQDGLSACMKEKYESH